MGFAIYRIDDKGKETPLPWRCSLVRRSSPDRPRRAFPIQKFYWKDPYARLVAEKTGNRTFRYKVVPLGGTPGKLAPLPDLPFVISNEIEITSTSRRAGTCSSTAA